MKITPDIVIKIAIGEIGYMEKTSNANLYDKTQNKGFNNYTKYGKETNDWGLYNGNKNGYAWCDQFVDWCFVKALGDPKLLNDFNFQPLKGNGAGCKESAGYYKAVNRFFETDPQKGDQIFFFDSNKQINHTGIITEVTSGFISYVEGNSTDPLNNCGGIVKQTVITKNHFSIAGFGRPNYNENNEEGIEVLYKYLDNNIPFGLLNELRELVDLGVLNYGTDGFEPALTASEIRSMVVALRLFKLKKE